MLATKQVFNNGSMSKIEILDELPKLTKTERQEIRLRLAELDSDDWLDDDRVELAGRNFDPLLPNHLDDHRIAVDVIVAIELVCFADLEWH